MHFQWLLCGEQGKLWASSRTVVHVSAELFASGHILLEGV